MKDPRLNAKAISIQMNHHLQPSFIVCAGGGGYSCNLIHAQTGEYKYEGRGNTEEEAFERAYSKLESAPKAANPEKVQAENENLREQLAAMESKLEVPEAAALETSDSDGEASNDAPEVAPVTKKKTRRRKKPSASQSPF